MAEHTKLPWRTGRLGAVVADEEIPEMSGANAPEYYGGNMICESVVLRNAEFIVRACNAHEDLLTQLRTCAGILKAESCCGPDCMCGRCYAWKQAEAEIAKLMGTKEEKTDG